MISFLWFALGWTSALLILCTAAGIHPTPRRRGFNVSTEGRRLHGWLSGRNE